MDVPAPTPDLTSASTSPADPPSGHRARAAVVKDGQSNVVVAGWTEAPDLPGATGTQQPAVGGGTDAFVSKFITTPTCPSGEDCADIGAPALTGDQLYSGTRASGTWSVTGAGSDIWGTSDQFHYVAQDAAGDGSISARLLGQANTGAYAKAGVMYRASEDPAAPYYYVALTPANGGTLQVQYRSAQGAVAQDLSDFLVTAPLYVRVRRAGNQFAADTSSDGQTWTALSNTSVTLDAMPATALAGLAVDSFTTGAASTATFDTVTITSCPTAWSCQDIGAPALAGDQTIRDKQSLEGLVNVPVRGGGSDIEGTSDQFHFVDTTLSGDGSISTRISSQQNTDAWAKAGVMLRASASADAPYYFVMVTPGNGLNVQYRATPGAQGGVTQWPSSYVADATPVYLRADRVGTTFSAYSSHDAVNWRLIPNSTVSLPALAGDLLAGPAVTSHNQSATSAATFDFVRVDQCPDGWGCGDVNTPVVPGGQYLDEGVWSIRGVGTGTGANAAQDQFRYAWQTVTDDSGLSAQLTGQVDTGTQAKAGLMYRADNTPGAPYFLVAMTANNGLVVQARTAAGGNSTTVATVPAASLPLYLQVTRVGSAFTAYTSPDDTTWTPIANASVNIAAMPVSAQLGLAVDSYDSQATSTATFGAVNITGASSNAPSGATPLSALNAPTMQYAQGSDGNVRLQLYAGPLGTTNHGQWQQRDTSLSPVSTTGMLRSANLAFDEQLAPPTSTAPMLAALTNEDGVTLTVGLAPSTNTPAPTMTGQVRTTSVMYAGAEQSNTTPSTTASDLSLLSTASGLDARIVLHSSSETGPFSLALSSDPSIQASQDTSGSVQMTSVITGYGGTTAPYTTTQTEYTVQPAILGDSNTSAAAAVAAGPATTTLTTGSSGQQGLTVSVDQAWLHDPSRVFPVLVDVPMVTGDSAAYGGLWGTVNSCAPNSPAPRTGVVVGTAGGCAYNGQLYVDTGSIPSDASIVSATLRLYTPAQVTVTGIQVYPNAPVSVDDPAAQAPTWNTAPTIAAGSTGQLQSASDGHWQSWDVTSLVRGWAQDGSTNGGLTLSGSGAPVLFSSPQGAGGTSPSLMPYLDVTYAPSAASGAFNDINGPNKVMYGVSGSLFSDGGLRPIT